MTPFDPAGALRRIRRTADCSQRELAERLGVSKSTVAGVESGTRQLTVGLLTAAAALAGQRLALVDDSGEEVDPMADGGVRDRGHRRFPAHLDTRHGDQDWWHGPERYSRAQPWYTFDRRRDVRDDWRRRTGVPADHQLPQPGDSPANRRAARQEAAPERREEGLRRRRPAGEQGRWQEFECLCPTACDALDDWSGKPVHADECPCRCDVG